MRYMVIIYLSAIECITMKFQTTDIKTFISKIQHPNLNVVGLLEHIKDKKMLIQSYVQSQHHKALFLAKITGYSTELRPNLNTKNLKIGQLVTFTNEYGNAFINCEILGFDNDPSYGRCVYLDSSSYWFAVTVDSLTVQDGYIGLTQDDLDTVSDDYVDSLMPWDLKILKNAV